MQNCTGQIPVAAFMPLRRPMHQQIGAAHDRIHRVTQIMEWYPYYERLPFRYNHCKPAHISHPDPERPSKNDPDFYPIMIPEHLLRKQPGISRINTGLIQLRF